MPLQWEEEASFDKEGNVNRWLSIPRRFAIFRDTIGVHHVYEHPPVVTAIGSRMVWMASAKTFDDAAAAAEEYLASIRQSP